MVVSDLMPRMIGGKIKIQSPAKRRNFSRMTPRMFFGLSQTYPGAYCLDPSMKIGSKEKTPTPSRQAALSSKFVRPFSHLVERVNTGTQPSANDFNSRPHVPASPVR